MTVAAVNLTNMPTLDLRDMVRDSGESEVARIESVVLPGEAFSSGKGLYMCINTIPVRFRMVGHHMPSEITYSRQSL